MRIALSLLLLGAALVAAPSLPSLETPVAALLAVGVAVLLAGLVCEGFTPLSVGLGALGALAHGALLPLSAGIAGAALVACVLGARSLRARTDRLRGVHLLASLAAGGVAAALAAHFSGESAGVQAAAALVAGLLACLPLALPADDGVTHALVHCADEAPEPARTALLRAAQLRRRAGGVPEGLSRTAARRLERAWSVLVDTARARLEVRGGSGALFDARIESHVEALERFHRAADERLARAAGLDDHALHAARVESEQLEAEAAALADVAHGERTAGPAAS
jgi:hypothetical protein